MSNHVGDLVLRSNYSDTGSTVESVTILRSDPVILIAAELLDQLRSAATPTHGVTLVDDVLTIRATNRTAVYHIGDYEHLLRAYRAEWPD